ncbi:MAG: MBL fold metallo-hydrolase [Burkholderiaceae bacterium]|jgi:glyoxylase-like metal-dependent hydrolase (beta-lactamase superfamily II)|nr:MBL fold metallo-hydrolase [Burkholderiaceae bacterium]
MKFEIIPVTPFQQNCTLMWDEKTNKAAVVDPGADVDKIVKGLERHGLTLEKVLVTHGHLDHCGVAKTLADRYGVPIEGPHEADAYLLNDLATSQTRTWGLPPGVPFVPDRWLNQGDTVTVGGESLQVYHVPGHSPGHIAFFHPASRVAISGDVLFAGSVGRTDLPNGSMKALEKSIRTNMYSLPDDTQFIPGHGPVSTIGKEKKHNPYVPEKR